MNESFAFSQFFLYIIIIDSIGSLVSVNDDSVVICSGLRDSWVRWIGRRRAAGGESESANTKIKREETGERRASFPLPESLEQATWIVIYWPELTL